MRQLLLLLELDALLLESLTPVRCCRTAAVVRAAVVERVAAITVTVAWSVCVAEASTTCTNVDDLAVLDLLYFRLLAGNDDSVVFAGAVDICAVGTSSVAASRSFCASLSVYCC